MLNRFRLFLSRPLPSAQKGTWPSSHPYDTGGEQRGDSPTRSDALWSWLKRRTFHHSTYQSSVPSIVRITAFLIACAVLLGAVAYSAFSPQKTEPSRLERVPIMNSTPGGERQQESQLYRETLSEANLVQADEAMQTGISFVSVPEGLWENVKTLGSADGYSQSISPNLPKSQINQTQAAEIIAQAASESSRRPSMKPEESSYPSPLMTQTTQTFARPEVAAAPVSIDENPHHALILRQMNAIVQGKEVPKPHSAELISESIGVNAAWKPTNPNEADAAHQKKEFTTIEAGSILMGTTIAELNSDVSLPVSVRITRGKVAGAVLIGSFQANTAGNGLIIQFGTLMLPNGSQVPVQAVAIDPFSGAAAVASQVDARLIQRYGPTLLTSFVSGFAASANRPALSFIGGGSGLIAASNKPTHKDNLIAGAGQAAAQAASNIADNAPKSPRIRLFSGDVIGILFLAPVSVPNHS